VSVNISLAEKKDKTDESGFNYQKQQNKILLDSNLDDYDPFNKEDSYKFEPFHIGIGMGLDFGGLIGLNILVTPIKNIGIYGGVGYALIGYGYNVGARLNLTPSHKTNLFITGMYGYNAAIKIANRDELNKFFYGTTVGFGVDFRRQYKKGFWSLALLVPIRDSEVNYYIDHLKDDHNVEFKNSLYPIAISVGYRF